MHRTHSILETVLKDEHVLLETLLLEMLEVEASPLSLRITNGLPSAKSLK